MKTYYSQLIPTLAERAQSGIMSAFGFSNVALRKHLNNKFDQAFGVDGALIGEPSFEAVFGWKTADKKFDELRGNLLETELVDALIKGDLEGHYKPYEHQIEAWKILGQSEPQSAIISSGTGSGKTECFMVPILNRLVKQVKSDNTQIEGVRALFLYPLNALINSQRERLQTWTSDSKGKIRFCLYNGLTPERIKSDDKGKYPNEVQDRQTLRESPPPILVTNPTMLEYMLVRALDNPIIQKSKGKLDTIVLDEAHTYIGSQAAEITLLLRRVLRAFGKQAHEVRFVATSATIKGGKDSEGKLRTFLAKIAGVPEDKVSVITGKRVIPTLHSTSKDNSSLQELLAVSCEKELYEKLQNHQVATLIRNRFIQEGSQVLSLNEVCTLLFGEQPTGFIFSKEKQIQALQWIDLLSGAINKKQEPFLPVRAHIFERTIPGLWACSDKACTHKDDSALESKDWPYGRVFIDNRTSCFCGGPVFEIISCKECGESYLEAQKEANKLTQRSKDIDFDEFTLELEDDEPDEGDKNKSYSSKNRVLITNRNFEKTGSIYIDKETRILKEKPDNAVQVILKESEADSHFGCPACMDREYPSASVFRTHAVGAPSQLGVLMPTLLSFAVETNENPNLPYKGRRLLSFNDSRQGTARIAAKLQQEAERVKGRGLIYHHLLSEGAKRDQNVIKSLQKQITALDEVLKKSPNDVIKDMVEKLRAKLSDMETFSSQTYRDLEKILSLNHGDFSTILSNYKKYAPEIFGNRGQTALAELMIYREFARRPRKQNSLETLGLVFIEYPQFSEIRNAPDLWLNYGLNLEEWRVFLGICCDFFVRAGGSLHSHTENLLHWMGSPFFKTYLVGPKEEDVQKKQRRWPNVHRGKTRSRVVRYLLKLTGADPDSRTDQDKLDEILEEAWNELSLRTQLLTRTDSGYLLSMDRLSFTVPEKVWVCPITRRFIDKTIRGITPYLPSLKSEVPKCIQVHLPRYDAPFGETEDPFKNMERAQKWLKEKQVINELRDEGYWSLFNDKVIELSPYYRTAEHSAQQDSNLLQQYEDEFKKGYINILACSTTMEMGIDIGGIRMVSMNNLPPNPANYLQRAGRAGRRRETRSTTVTLCKPNPHDLSAFYNSKWAFETMLPSPAVSLHSELIVQRHINALLLSVFFNEHLSLKESDKHKLTTGWFYGMEGGKGESPYQQYLSWLLVLEINDKLGVKEALKRLVVHSSYESVDPGYMLKESARMISAISEKWKIEHDLLVEQQKEILEHENKKDPAARAVEHQLKRLTGEYLLREFAAKGFLPGYGFPSGIAVFDNYNVSKFKREQESRDDVVFNYRSLPSRDIVTALREYAPGAQIVLDGVVYKSAGITLNWHIPNSEKDVKESQAIKYAWRCVKCGASDTTYVRSQAMQCHNCSEKIKPSNIERFIEPSGFATDFYDFIHNDVTTQQFIPVENPWIQSDGEWKSLSNPALGRYRSSSKGSIYHHSKGLNGTGYGICMMCGRAEPMEENGDLPNALEKGKSHQKLKGSKKSRKCPGSNNQWAVMKNLSLGSQSYTDVFELQLKSEKGEWLNCKNTAATLAVVLRDAFASLMGIESTELICDVQEKLTNDSRVVQSIFIYDRNASGFMSSTDHLMGLVFQKAHNQLSCKKNCNANCPSCVLDYDQRFKSEQLDRHKALEFLSKDWLVSNSLPTELAYLGVTSQLENRNLTQALIEDSASRPEAEIVVADHADLNDDFDFPTSQTRQLVSLLAVNGRKVRLALKNVVIESLSESNALSLLALMENERISLSAVDELSGENGALFVAGINSSARPVTWVRHGSEHPQEKMQGGFPGLSDGLLIKGNVALQPRLRPIDSESLKSKLQKVTDLQVELWNELDGPVNEFGGKFWNILLGEHSGLEVLLNGTSAKVESIEYSDRYLYSPLTIILLNSLLSALKQFRALKDDDIKLKIRTTVKKDNNKGPYNLVFSDWEDPARRNAVLSVLLEKAGYYDVLIVDKATYINHDRYIRFRFKDKTEVTIRFDQGMGYWKVSNHFSHRRQNAHDFSRYVDDPQSEAAALFEQNFYIVGGKAPSPVFVVMR